MKPIRIYIENFMCYDKSDINFNSFKSALIIGSQENNDSYSNGVGKSTIFTAIEYVLFNQADINLDKIIRDDTNLCKVVFDFELDSQIYRVSRTRTKKGNSDLSLYERTAAAGSEQEINDINSPEKFWKNISGRRAGDTEKELTKLIKINYKAFRSTIHFVQHDFTGLPTLSPEKRKGILKESLHLLTYSKLEKLAKEKASAVLKEIEKHKTLIEAIGNPIADVIPLQDQLELLKSKLNDKNTIINNTQLEINHFSNVIKTLSDKKSSLEDKSSSLVLKEKSLLVEKSKLETSIKDYSLKKSNIIQNAKETINEISALKEEQLKLTSLDFSQIDILNEIIVKNREKIAQLNLTIQNNLTIYEELKIPMPDDSVCKHCRQTLSEEHRIICKKEISVQMEKCQSDIKISKKQIAELNSEILTYQQKVNSLIISKNKLEELNNKILTKTNEVQEKRNIHNEYVTFLAKFEEDLNSKIKEIELVSEEIKQSSLSEVNAISVSIKTNKQELDKLSVNLSSLNKELSHINSNIMVINHSIEQKQNDQIKKQNLINKLNEFEATYMAYAPVLQAFSSTGIPNLIIQDVLDDLQTEANNLLSQLKPGLQLEFLIEKTKGDGTQSDTLDINYFINGRIRSYNQLSGAQKISVMFSLKLGLFFVLKKVLGTNIQFLLLDEVDQPLDKASVDSFADLVKMFQNEFTILVITHNDRLKDKFSHTILVEQDTNMVSKARVISSC